MGPGSFGSKREKIGGYTRQQATAEHRVLLDLVEFQHRERAGLQEYRIGDGDLADVMQTCGQAQTLAPLRRLADRMSDFGGQIANGIGVLRGVAATEFGERCQTFERFEVVSVSIRVLSGKAADQFGGL